MEDIHVDASAPLIARICNKREDVSVFQKKACSLSVETRRAGAVLDVSPKSMKHWTRLISQVPRLDVGKAAVVMTDP